MLKKGESTKQRILDAAEDLFLKKGFGGASLNDILAVTGLTKGAFFHHFKSKDDLSLAVLQNYIDKDLANFDTFSRQASSLADNPLQETLIFLKLFEENLDGLDAPPPGCVLASYTYEKSLLAIGVQELVTEAFRKWGRYYEDKFERLLAWREPQQPTSVKDLTETIMAIIEGGFVISKAYNDKNLTIRLSRQFRNYLKLLFEG